MLQLKQWLKITVGPVFWIAATQVAWSTMLVLWIMNFTHRGPFLLFGLVMFLLMLLGVTVLVIHFARQVAHTRAAKDFVSRVSHELRSPLATVKLHLETVLMRDLTPEQTAGCLNSAHQELDRLEAGIEDVLTASRLDRMALKVSAEPLELRTFLGRHVAARREYVKLHHATLEMLSSENLMVDGDPHLLAQLLDNLINNALVHCQTGVKIGVSAMEHGRCAVISVADNGPGLPRVEWRKIFRMFYRVTPKGEAKRKGTGLGLFIVAGIAKAHRGRAWVESPGTGHGCLFRIAIPLRGRSA